MEKKERVPFRGIFIFTSKQRWIPAVFFIGLCLDFWISYQEIPEWLLEWYVSYQNLICKTVGPFVSVFMFGVTIVVTILVRLHEKKSGITLNEVISIKMPDFDLYKYLVISIGNVLLFIVVGTCELIVISSLMIIYEIYVLLTGCELIKVSWLLFNENSFFENFCYQLFCYENTSSCSLQPEDLKKDEFMLRKVYSDYHDKPSPEKARVYKNILKKCMDKDAIKIDDKIMVYRMYMLFSDIISNINKKNAAEEIQVMEQIIKCLDKDIAPYYMFIIMDILIRQDNFIHNANYAYCILHRIKNSDGYEEVKKLLFICFYIRSLHGINYTKKSIHDELVAVDMYWNTTNNRDILFQLESYDYRNGYDWIMHTYYSAISQEMDEAKDEEIDITMVVKAPKKSYYELFEDLNIHTEEQGVIHYE